MSETIFQELSLDHLLEVALSGYFASRDDDEGNRFLADFIGRLSFERLDELEVFYQRISLSLGRTSAAE